MDESREAQHERPAETGLSRSTWELAERSDRTLVELVQRGREDAATALYLRYATRLRALAASQSSKALASKVEADDIVQSVFRSFFRRASRGLYDVPQNEELWGLLLVLALNKIRAKGNYHGAAKRDVRRTVDASELVDSAATDSDALALADLQMAIDDVLARLPASYRPVVERRIAGEEIADVAEQLGRSKRTVERILQEFRRELLAMIEPVGERAEG